jgi:hypothetical protein
MRIVRPQPKSKKTHISENFAAHFENLPEPHEFRRSFEQIEKQLTRKRAIGVKEALSAILFLRNRGGRRIDFA